MRMVCVCVWMGWFVRMYAMGEVLCREEMDGWM